MYERSNRYSNEVAIVTGAASGIGRALAARLAAGDASVILADVHRERLEAVVEELGGGSTLAAETLDVRDATAVKSLVERVTAERGRLDYIFNNAGVAVAGEARDLELGHWRDVMEVNFWGVLHGTHAAYPLMIEQGFGHIINTASLAGLTPYPLSIPYAVSKWAVVGLSLSLRLEAKAFGVKVSTVCPGPVDTGIFDSTRFVKLDPETAKNSVQMKQMSPLDCAAEILAGVERNRALILVTRLAKISALLYRFAPGLVMRSSEQLLAKLRRARVEENASSAAS